MAVSCRTRRALARHPAAEPALPGADPGRSQPGAGATACPGRGTGSQTIGVPSPMPENVPPPAEPVGVPPGSPPEIPASPTTPQPLDS